MLESSGPVRTFIAINLPAQVLTQVAEFQRDFVSALPGAGIRWTPPEHIHLTVRFLGDVPMADLPDLENALRRACAGVGPFVLRVSGAGCFPDSRRPRILYVGLEGALDPLKRLHAAIEQETGRWGEHEDREFHPHLTLGRVKRPDLGLASGITRQLDQAARCTLGEWRVGQVDLMRSDLSSAGPRYTQLARVALALPPA